ncbi:hypothetical protein K491DRAFT_80595 [Lophiostoma macrostomum CBS 122681]|uniref:Uncharacterized protein n=1 Tax=Lophiostoma macrostomum CBS 122681 TaxID=1314788 RepID=A0A6A6TKJ0_9PLEO|nr:hypothetical protein K491DRAFT_80595 [Lophiostoma macrostomum CBS 122681]
MKYFTLWSLISAGVIGSEDASSTPAPIGCNDPNYSKKHCQGDFWTRSNPTPTPASTPTPTSSIPVRAARDVVGEQCFFVVNVTHSCDVISKSAKIEFYMPTDETSSVHYYNTIMESNDYPPPGNPADITTSAYTIHPMDDKSWAPLKVEVKDYTNNAAGGADPWLQFTCGDSVWEEPKTGNTISNFVQGASCSRDEWDGQVHGCPTTDVQTHRTLCVCKCQGESAIVSVSKDR